MYFHWLGECIIVLAALRQVSTANIKECTADMIKYDFTECKDDARWKVAIPKLPDCVLTTPQVPEYQAGCEISCLRGEFLDENTQSCRPCPAGTYSLGNGIRYDRWDQMPEGFSVVTTSSSFPEFGYSPKVSDCSTSGWTARDGYISSGTDDCSSSLTYTVDIASTGSMSFMYQSTDEDLIFHFFVRNGDCQISASDANNKFLTTTGTTWKKYTVLLEKGRNLLTWKTNGLLLGTKTRLRPALIKEIEIFGVPFLTKCHPCKPGYFSDSEKSDWCRPCVAGTYSKEGAIHCTKCNETDHYSHAASPECIRKPPCTVGDYFHTLSSCRNGKTIVSYAWNSPQICREDMKVSVALPKSGIQEACPPCNPGFYSGKSGCAPCPKGSYSKDGNSNCKNCPVGSHPVFAYTYHWWDTLPSNMAVSCLTIHQGTCLGPNGWLPNGGMIASSASETPVAYLLLKLEIIGFHSVKRDAAGESEYGKLGFVFELKCFDDCVLYLMKNAVGGSTRVLASWHKKTEKTSFEYIFRRNETMNVTLAYQKTSRKLHDDRQYSGDMAVIYSMELYNAIGAPAIDCINCVAGTDDSGCIPCPSGHKIDANSKSCVKCPPNTILPHETIQSQNCSVCNAGTRSNKAQTACQNDCVFDSSINNRSYDFNKLSTNQLSVTPPSFSGGHKYVHYYNFSVCGNNGFGNARCSSNNTGNSMLKEEVSGMICRSTRFTSLGDASKDMHLFSQPKVIASVLKEVYEDTGVNATGNEMCGSEIFPAGRELYFNDIVYRYAHPTPSDDCSSGTTASVRLRCDPEVPAKESTIVMPKNYPEGSCDGCNFHFLWESEDACPECEDGDYYSVKSGCEDGFITTKYLWRSYPKRCRGGSLPEDSKIACTDVKFYIEVGVLAAAMLLSAMLMVTFLFWRKNRNLEYKYQRLVGNSDGNSELKAAETCAVSGSESDSDDDAVVFRKRKAKMMKKDETVPLNHSQNFLKM